jgi:hypothetical protein
MHKEVNSGLSIAFILVAALAVFTYSRIGMEEIDRAYDGAIVAVKAKAVKKMDKIEDKVEQKVTDCKSRMFEGEVKLKVWRDGEPVDSSTKEVVVHIVKDDLAKLPIILSDEDKADFKAKLVDATQDIELELNKHSKTSPVEITIKGYKFVCQGMNLISLNPPLEALKNI